MDKCILLVFLLLLHTTFLIAQDTHTINGYVADAESGRAFGRGNGLPTNDWKRRGD